MTLTEFLLARIAEDEAVARSARTPSTWFRLPSHAGWHSVRGESATSSVFIAEMEDAADAAHIARHDPARVLAECEARRAVAAEARWDADVLRWLALPYADHTDYDEAWRP